MILALDISTSCTGYCIFDENGLVKIGYVSLTKKKDFYQKADEIKHFLKKVSKEYKIENIVVEENLQAFRPGLSSAKTLMTLAQFNGTVRWIAYEEFNLIPVSINVNTARKAIGLKIDKKDKSKTTKEKVLEWVSDDNSEIVWPTKVLKNGRNKGQTKILSESYDMADAYVIGKSFLVKK